MSGFIKNFFNLEERILDDATPKRRGWRGAIDKIVEFTYRNTGKISIIPAILYGHAMNKMFWLFDKSCYLLTYNKTDDVIPDINNFNSKFFVFSIGAYTLFKTNLDFLYLNKISRKIDKTVFIRKNKFKKLDIAKIGGILLVGYCGYLFTDFLYGIRVLPPKMEESVYNNFKTVVTFMGLMILHTGYLLYNIGSVVSKSRKVVAGKFYKLDYFIPRVAKTYFTYFVKSLNRTHVISKTIKFVESKLSQKINKALMKKGLDKNPKSVGVFLSYVNDEIKEFGLLEKTFNKVKQDQEKIIHNSEKYVSIGDLFNLISSAQETNKTSMYLYTASAVYKDYKKISEYIIKKIDEKNKNNFRVQAQLHLFRSVFEQKNTEIQNKNLLALMSQSSKIKIVFGTEKKVTLFEFDSETGRVLAESDYDFFDKVLLSKHIYLRLLQNENNPERIISSDYPVSYFRRGGKFCAISLLANSEPLENILNNLDHEKTARELIKNGLQYQSLLTESLEKNNKYTVQINFQGKNYSIDVPKINPSTFFEERVFRNKKSDESQRFIFNNLSKALVSELKEYEERLLQNSELFFNHGDYTTTNILINPQNNEYTHIDCRPVMADCLYDLSTMLSQGSFHINIDKKREILLQETGKSLEEIDYFLLNSLFCEAGSDLAHNRRKESVDRKIGEILQVSKNKPYESSVHRYLKSEGFL